jgi:GNAT superfamily N-acetyltransferase
MLASAPFNPSSPYSLRRLSVSEMPAASALLGQGMRDNPTHVCAFGNNPERRRQALVAMFAPFMRRQAQEGVVFGAFIEDKLVGVSGFSLPGQCQPALKDKLCTLPALFLICGPVGLWHVLWNLYRWTRVWARRDANTPPHWHLGPLAIEPQWQGQGIGSALLKRLCDQLDQHQALGYLETDRQENVRLYERFGFTTVATEPVLGATHWFMQRRSDDMQIDALE